jgi:hypothetical protein
MHNGVLDHSAFPGSKKASDTMQYVAQLRAMLQSNPQTYPQRGVPRVP